MKPVPPVRVAVAVDVTLSCAAWRGAFQHVLVHRQDFGARRGRGEGKGSKNNLIKNQRKRRRKKKKKTKSSSLVRWFPRNQGT